MVPDIALCATLKYLRGACGYGNANITIEAFGYGNANITIESFSNARARTPMQRIHPRTHIAGAARGATRTSSPRELGRRPRSARR